MAALSGAADAGTGGHLMADTAVPVEPGRSAQKPKDEIKVTVEFPLGQRPFQRAYGADTRVAVVLDDARAHFGAVDDPALRFYLVFHGLEVVASVTLADVAGSARAVKFTLVREIVNG
jgi:hypothetical protein